MVKEQIIGGNQNQENISTSEEVKNWKKIHLDFTEELQKEWEDRGFSYEETKKWIEAGLWLINYEAARQWRDRGFNPDSEWIKLDFRHDEYNIADFLRWKGYQPEQINNLDLDKLRKECQDEGLSEAYETIYAPTCKIMKSYQQLWEKEGFTYQETKQWINAGFRPIDVGEVRKWKKMDVNTQQIQEWTQLGFEPEDYSEVKKWKDQGLDLKTIEKWIKIGFKPNEAEVVKKWKEQGFALQEVQQWLGKGLNKGNAHFAKFLLSEGYVPTYLPNDIKLSKLREEYLANTNDWNIIHEDFSKKDYRDKSNQQYWEEVNFTYSEVEQWIRIGFKPEDYKKVKEWKNYSFTPQQVESWISVGLNKKDIEFAIYLREKGHQPSSGLNLDELKKVDYKDRKSAQEWLDSIYPASETKDNCKEIKIGHNEYCTGIDTKLEGSLRIEDFKNLSALIFPYNKLTSLYVNNCPNLTEINCNYNKLKELKITNCPKLAKLDFWGCRLIDFDFSSLNPESLVHLQIGDNNLSPRDVSCLAPFTNLEWARIGTMTWQNQELEEAEDIRNRFYGSLKVFKNMKKLRDLNIANTDIDSGLEYLPKSLEKGQFECHSDNDEFKVSKIQEEWEYLRKDTDSTNAQKWLDENYPENERKDFRGRLDISKRKLEEIELKGKMKLEGFTNLKKLICSNQQLTYLFLDDCKNLTKLQCNNNKFPNLNFLDTDLISLKELDISNCPIEGSLKSLEGINGLEELDISNTNIMEGLEYLPESCKKLCCNSDYQYKSTKIMEELDKSKCAEEEITKKKYYNLDKWRIDKQNSMISSIIPLERLYVIRGNIKYFVSKWGIKKVDDGSDNANLYDKFTKLLTRQENKKTSELRKLQQPDELWKYRWTIYGTQFIGRGAAVAGAVLTFQDQSAIGGGILGIYPFTELIVSKLEENVKNKEDKWKEFLNDADTFLDNYNELLGILAPIEIKNLKEEGISKALKDLDEKIKKLLEYDEDKNKEIDIKELTDKRHKLTTDLDGGEKSEIQGIVNSIKSLEESIIEYRKSSYKWISEKRTENNSRMIGPSKVKRETVNELETHSKKEIVKNDNHQIIDLDKHFEEQQTQIEQLPK
ncbi:MAG: hypothetical protein I3273_01185 [Candidatus Moeniiplasma glomeromycotorum]|nr:hypothetical protein [Candidatus Moeniiplasma glomeromycotorum]MCE8167264.1 hypothetical protein [Candidatus Moeniiplasma glomeromycotorum]MCE8168723.1 hypothetical protein [Candidatus Moeniiplasma glomeromycotorum]